VEDFDGGGEHPRWRGDGKALFYVAADGTMAAVAVKASGESTHTLEAGAPVPLFDAHLVPAGHAKTSETGADIDHWSATARRADDRLQRSMRLEKRLARTPQKSPLHRTLRAAVRGEAVAYCRALDGEQAAATYAGKPST
jgi:hypothetical protein